MRRVREMIGRERERNDRRVREGAKYEESERNDREGEGEK